MDENKSLFQKGFFVLKNHVTRMIALSMSMIALLFLFVLFAKLIGLNYQIRWVAFWKTEYLFTKEWLFAVLWVLLGCLVCLPFELGARRWFYSVCAGQEQSLGIIFCYFEDFRSYVTVLWFRLMLNVRKLFWYLVCLLPSFLIKMVLDHPVSNSSPVIGTLYGTMYVLWVVTLAAGLLGGFYFNLKYFLSYYLWFESPGISPMEAVRISVSRMKGKRKQAFVAYVAVLPLLLLCVFVFPILAFLPSSYVLLSVQANEMISSHQKDV